MSVYELVHEFHDKYGLPISIADEQLLDTGDITVRKKIITEEYDEVMEALKELEIVLLSTESTDTQIFNAHTHMLKELCDLVYVAVGTSVSFGYSFDDGFKSVHTSNMTKDGSINNSGKITKGPSYKEPEELGRFINGRI
jgi:predicted HAD superfamily Cof-like phosphohydrolase